MKFYTRRRVSPVITIVSLVDILTMVLMFFVYTTTFKTLQPQVNIVLPKVQSSGDKAVGPAPAFLSITKEGDLYLNDKPIALDALADAVKRLTGENRTLAMKPDENAPFGKIMQVLDELKLAGVQNLPAFTRGPQQSTR